MHLISELSVPDAVGWVPAIAHLVASCMIRSVVGVTPRSLLG